MLYTGKGDGGMSGLWGTRERFPKDSPIYDALGTLDELNSLLGVCRAHSADVMGEIHLPDEIHNVQEALFIIQAELAGSPKSLGSARVVALERIIDSIENLIGGRQAFVIPGATVVASYLDYARTVARRAERHIIERSVQKRVGTESLAFLNRLSSFLFALARYAAFKEGVKEASPSYS